MNLDDKKGSDLRFADLNEKDSYSEGEEADTNSRPKTPSKYV